MNPDMNNPVIMHADHLVKQFPVTRGSILQKQTVVVYAVDDLTFDIFQGETLGLVGETGCGKSTLAKCLLQLVKPTSGHVYYKDKDIEGFDGADIARKMQLVTQDPMASLNPKKNVREIIGGNLRMPGSINKEPVATKIKELLIQVGLNNECLDRYPIELSGAEKQRVNLARSLAFTPSFTIYDDPFSMLDSSSQVRVMSLLEENQNNHTLTYLLISHDFTIIHYLSNRVAVMYLGEIVELSPKDEIFRNPLHPYTRILLSAVPIPDPTTESKRNRIKIAGGSPSKINAPQGCRFRLQCPMAEMICAEEKPVMRELLQGHYVSCHLVD